MIIHKQHLKSARAIDKNNSRPVLGMVKLDADHNKGTITSVGTNSFMLIEQTEHYPVPASETLYLNENDVKHQAFDFSQAKTINHLPVKNHRGSDVTFTYPLYEGVFPKTEPVGSVMVSVEMLKDILEAFTKEKDSANSVVIEFHAETQPLVFKGVRSGLDIRALLMPIRQN